MNTTLEQLVAALIMGSTAATGIIHLKDSATFAVENLSGCITHQEETVNLNAELFPHHAAPALEQWAARKPVGVARLNALGNFAQSGNTTELEKVAQETP